MTHILAIDQGTTGTTVLIVHFDNEREVHIVSRGYAELPQYFPQPGWVEHDLDEIWQSVKAATAAALQASNISARQIDAIGITNQRETVGVWDRRGQPLCKAIVWQDRRTAEAASKLQPRAAWLKAQTGLVADPYFSGTKIDWMLENDSSINTANRQENACFGTMDTWLVYRLTRGRAFVTDVSNASRTMLCGLSDSDWSQTLADAVCPKLKLANLSRIASNAEIYGHTEGLDFLPDGIPISGMAGDQQAALFGQGCTEIGQAKCTFGTGAFILMQTGETVVQSEHGLLTTIAWQFGDRRYYALEGASFIAGAAVQWLRDGLEIIKSSAEIEGLAAQVSDTEGVVFVPAFTGLGAPYWDPHARGSIQGLTRGSTKAHIARAALEGIAHQVTDLLEAMDADLKSDRAKASGQRHLKVDGGAARNDLLMQIQADLCDYTLTRPRNLESTALGAAKLAAIGIGALSQDKQPIDEKITRFVPASNHTDRLERRRDWQRAVARCRSSMGA